MFEPTFGRNMNMTSQNFSHTKGRHLLVENVTYYTEFPIAPTPIYYMKKSLLKNSVCSCIMTCREARHSFCTCCIGAIE